MSVNGQGEIGINIDNVRELVCPSHEGALAADRSVSPIIFPLEVLWAVLRDERTQLACGWDPDTGELADPARVQEFLPRIAPACEWIAPAELEKAWGRAKALGHEHRIRGREKPPEPH